MAERGMTPERWRKVQEAIDSAGSMSHERGARLAVILAGDPELLREAEELLSYDDRVDDFLAKPAVPELGGAVGGPSPGSRIGPYRILELVGRGGMGTVYRAVREDDFEKEVAIKVVTHDLESTEILRRFASERQILARLEHPSIARLLDGGTTVDGQPYLVMEFVNGEPLDDYCDRHRLGVRARLELFVRVASAVEMAHRHLVIHRDLKPENVLVDADGIPKLLDFGIAKGLDEGAARAFRTRLGGQPMTPRWASPEQIRGAAVGTATDVYGLGLLLYRLLTGRLPCGLEDCGLPEIPRRICEEHPQSPSTAVIREARIRRADGGLDRLTPEATSAARDSDPRRLRRALAGDLDAIVGKSLRKEPSQRYASVERLREDVRSFLAGLPVSAQRGSRIYRTKKFIVRHRWPLATGAVLFLWALGFVAIEFQRLADEKRRAEHLATFLREMVLTADPDEFERGVLTPRRLLDTHRDKLSELDGEPDLQASMLDTLALLYRKLGLRREARQMAHRSLEVWRTAHPRDHPDLAKRINNVAALDLDEGDWQSAETLFREALAMRRRLGQAGTEDVVKVLNNLATSLYFRGELREAEELYRRGLEIRLDAHGSAHPLVATSRRSLGAVLYAGGDLEGAEEMLEAALETRSLAFGPSDTKVASALDLLGRVQAAAGSPQAAEESLSRAHAIHRARLGDDHLATARSALHLATLLIDRGNGPTGRELLARALAVFHRRAPEDWETAEAESVLGALWAAEGRGVAALPCLVESYRFLRDSRGAGAAPTLAAERRLQAMRAVLEGSAEPISR